MLLNKLQFQISSTPERQRLGSPGQHHGGRAALPSSSNAPKGRSQGHAAFLVQEQRAGNEAHQHPGETRSRVTLHTKHRGYERPWPQGGAGNPSLASKESSGRKTHRDPGTLLGQGSPSAPAALPVASQAPRSAPRPAQACSLLSSGPGSGPRGCRRQGGTGELVERECKRPGGGDAPQETRRHRKSTERD